MVYVRIDYEYGKASFWSSGILEPITKEAVLERFKSLASQCFGIRKFLGETKVLELSETPFPPYINADIVQDMLSHSGGDVIMWDKSGKKIESEWED